MVTAEPVPARPWRLPRRILKVLLLAVLALVVAGMTGWGALFQRTHAYKGRARYNWKVLLSGYAAEYGYELGMLDSSIPFAELSQACMVNAKAQAADQAPDFSLRIREGIPSPPTLHDAGVPGS